MAKSLTIGMSTFDDYDGVYFSVQAIRLYHPEVKDSTEILIVDNNPTGHCSLALRKLEKSVSGCRYVANHGVQSTASKDVVFREAQCPYILCIDSHVMLVSGAIQKLITYFEQNPESKDLLQGPLLYDNLSDIATHFRPVWSGGMHGVWANDPQGADEGNTPFEIPMQGMGLFSCRKDAWLGFNPRFVGFGGEEGYIP
jgi:hypothetical protein